MAERSLRDGGIAAWFVDNPVAANLFMVLLLIGGALTASGLRSEEFPTLSPRSVNVTVPYPGATPEDIEEAISKRVEEAVIGVDGVERVRSTSREGSASISLELNSFADARRVREDVQSAVDSIANFPPLDAEQPIIRVPQATGGVVTLAVTGDVSDRALRDAAARVERDLVAAPGISLVSLSGARAYEISIEVSEATLRAYGLTFADVASAVRRSSIDLSGGSLRTSEGDILVRTNERREDSEALSSIVVRSSENGAEITLGEIATISDGFVRDRLSNQLDGEAAIFLNVERSITEDVIAVKRAVDRFLADYEPPEGVAIAEVSDQTEGLRDRIDLLLRNGAFGFALVLLVLVLIVDLKLAFWVSVGIATAFTGGFLLSSFAGVTINGISLFGLIIVLGLVVDDAIVIGEAIDQARRDGLAEREAAIEGVKKVRAPVIVGVITTIGAFFPLLVAEGGFSEISRQIPIVVIATLTVSLIEAFFILPSHLAHGGSWTRPPLSLLQKAVGGTLTAFAGTVVYRVALATGALRYATVAFAASIFFVAIGLVTSGRVPIVPFPDIEPDSVGASVLMPDGTPFERTASVVDRLVAEASRLSKTLESEEGAPVIEGVIATTGGRISGGGGPGGSASFTAAENIGRVTLNLVPSGERRLTAADIERRWRAEVGPVPSAESLTFSSSFINFGADVSFDLSHPDDRVLSNAAASFEDAITQIDGIEEVENSLEEGKRELIFGLTAAGRAAGLRPEDLARQVRQAVFGEEVQRIQRGGDEVRVFVRYPQVQIASLSGLSSIRIRLPDGDAAPLFTVATVTEGTSSARITRVDGRRVLTVSADVDEEILSPGEANLQIIRDVLPVLTELYPGLRWTQSGAAEQQREDFASLGRVFIIVLLVIYAVVASQLRSYFQPFAILIAIPMAVAGAIFGHLVLGYPLSFVSVFGIIALAGVSVNASVVLIDDFNQRRRRGIARLQAAAEASSRRFRPVLLTTLTTALGIAPILGETSPQAQFLIPLGVSLGFGILVSGALVLIVTPAVTLIIDDFAAIGRFLRRERHSAAAHTYGEQGAN